MRRTTTRQRVDLACAVGVGIALTAGVCLGIGNLTSSEAAAPTPTVTVTAEPVVVTKVVTKVKHTLPECEQEDSRNCIWHADESGNGEGVTFVDVDGTAYYAEGSLGVSLLHGASKTAQNLASITHSTLGDLLVCDDGLKVSVDTTPDGHQWAACM